MANKNLEEIAEDMRDIDIVMLSTHTDKGEIASRPMSNNGEVEYKGDSFYFTWDSSRMVRDIQSDDKVALSFQGSKGLLGNRPYMIAVEGAAELVRDKQAFEAHWTTGLDRWFENGVDTPGLVMIKVHATRIKYWDGEDDGELVL